KPEEKEARDVIVNFNVDPEKGEFTDPAGAKVVTFTIKEDDGNQYLVPTVEAKEGYVFTGWLVNGEDEGHWDADAKTFGVTGLAHFPEGSNEGYVTVTAQFEEVKPEVAVANANVVVDPDKGSFDGYDGATTLNNEHLEEADYTLGYLPTVTANDGYKWTGWVVTNKAGETILDLDTNASSIAFDYGVADTYTVTAKFEEVKPEVAVANANVVVDPVKGSFDGYDGATTLNNEHLEEADYTLGYLPTVTANDGYKWTGWVVTNKAGETILDLDT
ncbi:InlB B-repeat-containing protein, partial [Mediterraneibacter faecis]|uniref:InlB B-repeat-containing protein n=1 Tax=Mediterraneibacter faecis TaxID=592978 RepID=UPI003F979EB4